jgi:peptide deformylase
MEDMPLTILKGPHPMLRTICRPDFVVDFGVIQEMFTLMKEAGGLGLAAPQVGIDARLFVTSWGEVFVNPKIERAAIPCTVDEGCLSVPGVSRVMGRHHKIVLADGRQYAAGRAIVIQHELDHLNGILISDK